MLVAGILDLEIFTMIHIGNSTKLCTGVHLVY